VAALAARFGAPSCNYDDYETITRQPPQAVQRWLAEGSDYDRIEAPGLGEALTKLAAGIPPPPLVLFDALLGRAYRPTAGLITLSIWIDTPADIALARKTAQAAAGVEEGEGEDFVTWLRAWLGHYERFIAPSYVIQRQRVMALAHVVIDGRQSADAVEAEAVEAIAKRLVS